MPQAAVFDPTRGDLDYNRHRYLVVDVDGSGSYEAGSDIVVQFAALSGTLGLSDFQL